MFLIKLIEGKKKKLKPTNKIADEEEGVTVGINSGGVVRQK